MDNKIRILVAYNDQDVANKIVNSIKELDYAEVIGTAMDGIDACNKMIELKPEVVFSKYNYSNITGLELIKKTKEKMQDDFPIFNTIGEIPDEELLEVVKITEGKLNANVDPSDCLIAKDIIKAYKEVRNK